MKLSMFLFAGYFAVGFTGIADAQSSHGLSPQAVSIAGSAQPQFVPLVPVNNSDKTQEQIDYELRAEARLQLMAQEIRALNRSTAELEGDRRESFENLLCTASVKRAEARARINQLKHFHSGQWKSLKSGIETALFKLESSIERAKDF